MFFLAKNYSIWIKWQSEQSQLCPEIRAVLFGYNIFHDLHFKCIGFGKRYEKT